MSSGKVKILVIEDDLEISHYIKKGLQESGYTVDTTDRGDTGLEMAMNNHYEAGIVDLMLPGLDGLSLIEKLRNENSNLPILILSARRGLSDRTAGLKTGANDYLVKPFSISELLLRLETLLRKPNTSSASDVLTLGDISMNLETHEVFRQGSPVDLQPRECSLLELFLRNPGIVLSKKIILEKVWDFDIDPQTNVVDVLISRLRGRIDKDFSPKMIQTVRGIGYVFKEPSEIS